MWCMAQIHHSPASVNVSCLKQFTVIREINAKTKFSHTHKHRHKSSTSACASLPVHENGHSYNDAPHLVVLWLLHNGVIGELQLLLQVKAQIL